MLADLSFSSFGHTGIFLSLFTLSDTHKVAVLNWEWSGMLPLTLQGTFGNVGRQFSLLYWEGAPGIYRRGQHAANVLGRTARPATRELPSQMLALPRVRNLMNIINYLFLMRNGKETNRNELIEKIYFKCRKIQISNKFILLLSNKRK